MKFHRFLSIFMMKNWIIFIISIFHVPGILSMFGHLQKAETRFNYVVTIGHRCASLCSGVIINKKHIITVGHCLQEISIPDLIVQVGTDKTMNFHENIKKVHSVWFHPKSRLVFNPLQPNKAHWSNDIAVIRLKNELIMSTNVGFANVRINDNNWSELRQFGILAWYQDWSTLPPQVNLGWTLANVIETAKCPKKNTNLLPNEKCIAAGVVLEWDKGSPLIDNDIVMAIVVSGGSTQGEPITVLQIAPYVPFIESVVRDDQVDTNHDEFRYFASIWINGNLMCGGVIVHSFHIVTSGFCVRNIEPAEIKVVVGKTEVVTYLDITIEWLEVESFVLHPKLSTSEVIGFQSGCLILHNIAVLKLKHPLVWSPTVSSAPILTAPNPAPELYYHVIQSDKSTIGDIATYIKLKLSPAMMESQYVHNIVLDNQFIVIGANSLPLTSNHNHGNPVFSDGLLIGLISSYSDDDQEMIYTSTMILSIHPYITFIESVIFGN